MYPLSGALPLLYVPIRVTCAALAALRNTFEPPRCRTSQYHRTIVLISVSNFNDLFDPVFDGVELLGLKCRANGFPFASSAISFCLLLFSLFLSSMGWLSGLKSLIETTNGLLLR